MRALALELNDDGEPFRWNEQRRELLRAELDAAFFHLYEVERDDVFYILDNFPIVARKDEARHGNFRTKRLITEIYDRMDDARRTGVSYQTVLNPPPSHGPRHTAEQEVH